MSNVLHFPADRIRPASAAAVAADYPKSYGEILLFTGVRYMRTPEESKQATSVKRRQKAKKSS